MWLEGSEKLFYQVYDGNGVKATPQPLELQAGSAQTPRFAQVTAIGTEGNFTITWSEGGVSNVSLFSRMYDASGKAISGITTVANGTGKSGAQLAANSDTDGWATAYIDNGKVKLVAYDALGTAGTPIDVFETGGSTDLEVAWLGQSKYIVAYRTNDGIKAKIVGTATDIDLVAAEAFDIIGLNDPATGKPNGQFVVISDLGANSIVAQHYDAAGVRVGNPVAIGGAQISSAGDSVSAIALKNGGYALAYIQADDAAGDQGDVYIRVVDVNGIPGPELKINARSNLDSHFTQRFPSIFEMADGRLSITWSDPTGSAGSGSNISSTIVDARIKKIKVIGTAGDDIYAPSEYGIGDPEGGDTLDGRDGIDTLTFKGTTTGGVAVNLGLGSGSAGDAAGDKYTNFENIIGSNFADTLVGSAVSNTINGAAGNDVIDGAGGIDEMNGGTGADIYSVDDTADRINESAAADIDTVSTSATYALSAYIENLFATGAGAINLTGNDWNNTIVGNEAANGINGGNGNDVLNAGAGNDVLEGGTGADILSGGDGIDALNGGDDNDTLSGGEGADNLNGGNGNDSLDGGNGDDVMQGGGGADVMNGGAGNDTYYIDDVNDQVVDGAGVDTVYLGVSYDVSRLGTIENITGIGAVDITLTGNAFNNVLTGNDGANNLIGGAGNDVLYGGAGNDRIHGQEGNDILAGGGGRDLFVFDKRPHKTQNVDRIVDYNVRDDSIYLENKYFKVTPAGSLSNPKQMASKYFYKGAKAHDRDDRIIYDQKKGILYYDSDGTGSSAAVKIATLDKKLGMTAKDFFVI
jgi:Ca2+-binding RTX toxin-like protein